MEGNEIVIPRPKFAVGQVVKVAGQAAPYHKITNITFSFASRDLVYQFTSTSGSNFAESSLTALTNKEKEGAD